MSEATPSMLLEQLGSLAPPERFQEALLASYRAETHGQRKALDAARRLADRMEQDPSLGKRLRSLVRKPEPPQGLYLVGPAGTGKTHLMAALYRRLMPVVPCAFMHSSQLFRATHPPEPLAVALAREGPDGAGCRVLMLDEVELDDAANEARLAHFLRVLSEEGVALVATSNARPNEFLSTQLSEGGAHRRFLTDALSGRCEVVFVEGDDRRRNTERLRRGCIFIGEPGKATAALRRTFEKDDREARWVSFDEVRKASTEIAHTRLIRRILRLGSVYIHTLQLQDSDDALRLLRIIDDLYVAPDSPALFFSAAAPPEAWFQSAERAGIAEGVADKFSRTASRLHEMCDVQHVE